MQTKLTREHYHTFVAAGHTEPGKQILKLFREELSAIRAANDVLEGRELTLSQGKAQLLNEIITIFEEAKTHVAALDDATTERRGAFY